MAEFRVKAVARVSVPVEITLRVPDEDVEHYKQGEGSPMDLFYAAEITDAWQRRGGVSCADIREVLTSDEQFWQDIENRADEIIEGAL